VDGYPTPDARLPHHKANKRITTPLSSHFLQLLPSTNTPSSTTTFALLTINNFFANNHRFNYYVELVNYDQNSLHSTQIYHSIQIDPLVDKMFHSVKIILVLAALFCTTLAIWCPDNNKPVCCSSFQAGTPKSLKNGWGITTNPSDGESFGMGVVCKSSTTVTISTTAKCKDLKRR
jgi:hypothetical protein